MIKSLLLVTMLMMSILFFSGCAASRISPKEHYALVAKHPVDAIIVPGSPFNGAHWDSIIKGRVIWAYILWKNGVTKHIIFSGAAVYTPFFESKIYGLYAQEIGIPKEAIYYDTLAQHSTENVYYSYLLAKQLGFKSVALATDPVQSFTLRSYLKRRYSTPIQLLPFVVDSIAKYNHLQPLIPIKGQHVKDFKSIKAKENFLTRWRGTLGRHIPWHQYPNGKLPPL